MGIRLARKHYGRNTMGVQLSVHAMWMSNLMIYIVDVRHIIT